MVISSETTLTTQKADKACPVPSFEEGVGLFYLQATDTKAPKHLVS